MIAKNIAPGLERSFSFEEHGLVNSDITEKERSFAKSKIFDGEYDIKATDIDPEMIEIAKANAKRAGQEGIIKFEVKDFKELALETGLSGMMVTNPPYDIRLKEDNIGSLYKNIDRIFRTNPDLKGGPITGYAEFDDFINLADYKKRKLYNGGELCYFYRRK
jgi:putative N6-adenine-specific DNA methylase